MWFAATFSPSPPSLFPLLSIPISPSLSLSLSLSLALAWLHIKRRLLARHPHSSSFHFISYELNGEKRPGALIKVNNQFSVVSIMQGLYYKLYCTAIGRHHFCM